MKRKTKNIKMKIWGKFALLMNQLIKNWTYIMDFTKREYKNLEEKILFKGNFT